MLTTLAVVTATVVGTMVGVEFAVAVFVNPILLRLPAGPSLEARADGARVLGRVMPFWYFGSLILTACLAIATWGESAAGAAIAAAGLLAVSVVMSIALLVPINNRSATWTADDHPSDWREQQQRWDRLHYARGNHRCGVRADARRRGGCLTPSSAGQLYRERRRPGGPVPPRRAAQAARGGGPRAGRQQLAGRRPLAA